MLISRQGAPVSSEVLLSSTTVGVTQDFPDPIFYFRGQVYTGYGKDEVEYPVLITVSR